ncbi:MerR family transcriptional regulator, partial [Streptomyces sp. SID7909]|nr:MerR family transcriptional regulator [Streptomyces sp. SID7909]
GARGVAEAVPTLIGMVAEAVRDVDAADALGVLAADAETAERIASALVDRLADPALDAPARRRLTQALADIPGPTATRALGELAEDGDRGVAVTAVYLLGLREG